MSDYDQPADFIKLTRPTLERAIMRAKQVHPFVRRVSEGVYAVSGSKGGHYRVDLLAVNGRRLGRCDCASRGACYHLVAAAALHISIQASRKGVAR